MSEITLELDRIFVHFISLHSSKFFFVKWCRPIVRYQSSCELVTYHVINFNWIDMIVQMNIQVNLNELLIYCIYIIEWNRWLFFCGLFPLICTMSSANLQQVVQFEVSPLYCLNCTFHDLLIVVMHLTFVSAYVTYDMKVWCGGPIIVHENTHWFTHEKCDRCNTKIGYNPYFFFLISSFHFHYY